MLLSSGHQIPPIVGVYQVTRCRILGEINRKVQRSYRKFSHALSLESRSGKLTSSRVAILHITYKNSVPALLLSPSGSCWKSNLQ